MGNTNWADSTYFKRLSSSGNVSDAGKAIDIVGYTIKSGGTAAVVSFLNGQATTAPLAWADQARAVSTEQSIALAYRVRLDQGCYVSFDGNTTAVTVFYQQMLT
jgi:hypothetical protein